MTFIGEDEGEIDNHHYYYNKLGRNHNKMLLVDTEVHDSCVISKTDFSAINPCNSGSLRRGEVIDGELSSYGLAAYPIPFRDILNVTLYDEEQEGAQIFTMIKIYDMLGKIVYSENKVFTDKVQTIDLSIISDGIYEMQVVDVNGNHYRVKLVKGGN